MALLDALMDRGSGWSLAGRVVAWAARLGMALLAVASVDRGNRTAFVLAFVFAAISLAVAYLAPPVLDACAAVLLLAHGWASLIGTVDSQLWGQGMHVAAPFLVAPILALAVSDGRLPGLPRTRRAALATALAGGLAVIAAWEILEATLTRLPGVHIHTERGDTLTDLALGTLAVAAGTAVAAALIWRRGPGGPAPAAGAGPELVSAAGPARATAPPPG
ncbi:MAG TPA: hypothetical protein VK951_00510 [Miltoncostaeaceae bacterium]|nr:hypothetical protein [Miltoncostaeaceae bacterium]